jgi:site-specific recombinase XerD
VLLSEAIEQLAVATRANGRSPATVKAYRTKLRHLVKFLGDPHAENVTTNDLRRYVASLWDAGLSPFTVSSRVGHLKRLFSFLTDEGVIKSDPSKRIAKPRPKRGVPKGISHQDFLALLATTEGDALADLRDRAIILFLADTGCRVGGLCGLQVGDLDFDNFLALLVEKGDKERFVPFLDQTAQALTDWLEVRPQESDYVFAGLRGRSEGALTPSGVIQMLKRRGKRAGVKGPHNPHSFRHAFARDYLKSGGDLASLSDLLGHEDVGITKAWYGVFTMGDLQEKHRKHSPLAILFGGNGDE